MKHIELLNDDADYLETLTMLPCCNTCNSEGGGGGGCNCNTYLCSCNVLCETVCTCNGEFWCGLFDY